MEQNAELVTEPLIESESACEPIDLDSFSNHPLNKLIGAYRNGQCTLNDLAKLAMPVISKISKLAARKVGVDADDLTQEMWTTFEKVIAVRFDVERQIEPFISGCARKVALSLLNPDQWKEVHLDDDGHSAVEAADSLINDDYYVDFEGDLDCKTAIDKIAKSMYDSNGSFTSKGNTIMNNVSAENVAGFTLPPMGGLSGGAIEVAEINAPVLKSEVKQKRKLTELQREIVEARNSLDMTQAKFAAEIDIDLFRLSSYEYGRANPPEYVMDKVRTLSKGGNPRLNQVKLLKKTYEQPMSDILKRWCTEYKLDYTNDQQMAMAMDTTSATIHRWKNDVVKPSVDEIDKYRLAFERGAKKMLYAAENYKIDRATGILGRA